MTIETDPELPGFYKKRVCYKYVKGKQSDACEGCQKSESEHEHDEKENNNKWTSTECTKVERTDACGIINFIGYSQNKQSRYIRIENNTSTNDFIQFLYGKKGWGLEMPNLILSVTGGAQNFVVAPRIKKAFKKGLIKAAASTGAWIVTGGTNTGVMKLVGEAVADESHKQDLTVFGIVTWGIIQNKELLISDDLSIDHEVDIDYEQINEKTKQLSVQLDPNHTHFVFVDDGSELSFGKEIHFRADLENEIREGKQLSYYKTITDTKSKRQSSENVGTYIPMVLIVVNGGPGTLETVCKSLSLNIPVLILHGSKGAADLISKSLSAKNLEKDYKTFLEELNMKDNDNLLTQLKQITDPDKSAFVNVFKLDSEEDQSDIELAILHAFLNSRKIEFYENLRLALKWNRSDIAKTCIFNGSEKFTVKQTQELLEMALKENKPEFVELILENRMNIQGFLTEERLLDLYTYDKFDFTEAFQKIFGQKDVTLKLVKEFLTKFIFQKHDPNIFAHQIDINNNEQKVYKYYELNIFLWAVFTNRFEIAKLFWKIGQNQIFNALLGSKISKLIAKFLPDSSNEFLETANNFEELSIGLLNLFASYNNSYRDLLEYEIDIYKMNCLDMAVSTDSMKFLSQSPIQNILTDLWYGNTVQKKGFRASVKYLLSCTSCGLLAPFLSIKSKTDTQRQQDTNALYKNKVRNFLSTPRVKFFYEIISYVMFLIFFSYVLLCKFEANYEERSLSIAEFMLSLWIISLFFEEIRQFYTSAQNRNKDNPLGVSFKEFKVRYLKYFEDHWNYMDLSGIFIYFFGAFLRYIAKSQEMFEFARIVYCFDLCIWYIRLLHVTFLFKSLGPKLVMIRKMLVDLMFFVFIIIIFVCAFGVTTYASMYPQSSFNWSLIRKIIDRGYWPIYGDMKILDDIERTKCDDDDELCSLPQETGKIFSYVLLMVYVIIANVLLINLLIAMFSSTFEDVQAYTNEIWKFQRYIMITKYTDSPILPPPLNLCERAIRFFTFVRQFQNLDLLKTASKKLSLPRESDVKESEQASKLPDFCIKEKLFSQEYLYNVAVEQRGSIESKMKMNAEKLDLLEQKINSILDNQNKEKEQILDVLSLISQKLSKLEERFNETALNKSSNEPSVKQ